MTIATLLCSATVAVLVNQVGYGTGRTKTLVVRVREPLTDALRRLAMEPGSTPSERP